MNRLIIILLCSLLASSVSVRSQPSTQEPPVKTYAGKDTIPYDSADLGTFAVLVQKLKPLQEEQQEKMEEKIRESGLSPGKYKEVHMAQLSKGSDGLSKRSIRKYKEATRKIQDVRLATKKKMDSIIRKEGMAPDYYNQMAMVYRKNARMRKEIRQLIK